jgi:hypothetical protein
MAAVVAGKPYDVAEIAYANNVEPDELYPLAGWATNLWRERLAPLFPEPMVEHSFSFVEGEWVIKGHPDVMSLVGSELRILDWKSGYLDLDATEQLKGYAWLGFQKFPQAETCRITKLAVRWRRADTLIYSRTELAAWWEWLKDHLTETDTYRPSDHCGRCPRVLECPAHANQVNAMASALMERHDVEALANDGPEQLAKTYELAKVIAKRCDEFKEAVKAEVVARGGLYGRLSIRETNAKSIDVARGYETIVEELSEAELRPMLKVSKGDIEDAVKAKAPKGQKGKAVTEFMDRLAGVGALTETKRISLEVIREQHALQAV